MNQLDFFQQKLPKKPYCSDLLEHGLLIRSVAYAVLYRYIQPNHPNSKLWLLYDIDRATSPYEITDDLGLPPPHFFIQNKQNGHAHVLYGMLIPIHHNAESSREAIRFAGAVDCGMTARLQADVGYGGLICKNPHHPDWRVWSSNHELYELSELAEYVDLSAYGDKRKNLPAVGLGRNCTLFERTRGWSYKAIRQGWPELDRWRSAVETRAFAYNDFPTPLHHTEVHHIAKSIAKWTHLNLNPAGFSEWQARQGRKGGQIGGAVTSSQHDMAQIGSKGGIVTASNLDMAVIGAKGGASSRGGGRPSKKQEQLEMVLELKGQGYSNRAIAEDLKMSPSTVSDWLRNLKS